MLCRDVKGKIFNYEDIPGTVAVQNVQLQGYNPVPESK
jgi:hypothetical protein